MTISQLLFLGSIGMPEVIILALIVLLPWVWSLLQPSFGYVFNDWLYRGLVFLVISCPCALVVSIPLGYFGGIGAASKLGILFKGGNYLDAITKIDTIVFDKTGTLTQGTFEVKSCRCAKDVSETRLLQAVASAEQGSTHPIAKAIVRHTRQQGISLLPAGEVKEMAGFGLETTVDGAAILVGNARLMEQHHIPCPTDLSGDEGTLILCAMRNAPDQEEYIRRRMGDITCDPSRKEQDREVASEIRAFVLSHGGIESATGVVRDYSLRAQCCLEILKPSLSRDGLASIAASLCGGL